MAAHRYWRLNLPPQSISNGTQLSEVQVRGSVGGADISGSATKTSTASTANFFDGNNATETYAFAGGNENLSLWIAFDFGAPTVVAEVYLRTGTNGTLAPNRLQIQYSDDGVTWGYMAPMFATAAQGASTAATFSGFSELTPAAGRKLGSSNRLGTTWPGAQQGHRKWGGAIRRDVADGGLYRVAGTVAIDGTPATPVRRRVRLFHRQSGRLVREVWSATDGTFAFERIALAEYLVVTDDYTRLYDAVAADAVTSVV